MKYEITCKHCKQVFSSQRKSQVYCTYACYVKQAMATNLWSRRRDQKNEDLLAMVERWETKNQAANKE